MLLETLDEDNSVIWQNDVEGANQKDSRPGCSVCIEDNSFENRPKMACYNFLTTKTEL